ncbi:hypothetical protein [Kitasatospora purpeofusca]|uniref:hypothetical protein n=1 Tax=Kitasatospora purpeofusca TaxID=67352 RepID=UPI0038181B6E
MMLSPGCWADDTDAVAVAELNARLDLLSPDLPGRRALRDLGARPDAWGGTKNPPACYGATFNPCHWTTSSASSASSPGPSRRPSSCS